MSEPVENEFVAQRKSNMGALVGKGYAPFGKAFKRTGRLAEIRAGFEENKQVSLAGRITTLRGPQNSRP